MPAKIAHYELAFVLNFVQYLVVLFMNWRRIIPLFLDDTIGYSVKFLFSKAVLNHVIL